MVIIFRWISIESVKRIKLQGTVRNCHFSRTIIWTRMDIYGDFILVTIFIIGNYNFLIFCLLITSWTYRLSPCCFDFVIIICTLSNKRTMKVTSAHASFTLGTKYNCVPRRSQYLIHWFCPIVWRNKQNQFIFEWIRLKSPTEVAPATNNRHKTKKAKQIRCISRRCHC